MNFDNLKAMSKEQLRELAGKQGLKIHHSAKPETIIKHIMEAALTPQPKPAMQHQAEKPQRPVDHNTQAEVEEALADIKRRIPEFKTIYNEEENTVHFRCKGAEECVNLAIPLRVIKMKAQNISRGKLALIGLNDHFDRTTAGGNSAYTNTVLAG